MIFGFSIKWKLFQFYFYILLINLSDFGIGIRQYISVLGIFSHKFRRINHWSMSLELLHLHSSAHCNVIDSTLYCAQACYTREFWIVCGTYALTYRFQLWTKFSTKYFMDLRINSRFSSKQYIMTTKKIISINFFHSELFRWLFIFLVHV